MRTYVRAAGLALTISVLAASGAAAQGPQKFAYINSQVILQQAPGRAAAEAQIKKEQDTFQRRIKLMQDSMVAMQTAYQKDVATLTPAVQAQRQEAILKKQQAFTQEADQLEQKFAESSDAASRPIMELFNRVLNDVRAAEGYAFIFDVGSQAQAIVAADKNLDISEKIIAGMRTAAAAAPAANRPATTPAKPTGPVTSPTGVRPPPTR